MSDFDDVLERLLGDPVFKARLAADPAAALAGYRLAPDEVALLRSQVSEAGGQSGVEVRTSKASLFGLLSPLAGIGSSLDDAATAVGAGPFSQELGSVDQELGSADQRLGSAAQVSDTPVHSGIGPVEDHGLADSRHVAEAQGFGERTGTVYRSSSSGGMLGNNLDNLWPAASGASAADAGDQSGLGAAVGDYHTRVDADGDGKWDEHVYVGRADGGVDIVVDADRDGRAEFVGHDLDRDGLIDEASTDADRDGRLDTRWVDVNGDGWLDRKQR